MPQLRAAQICGSFTMKTIRLRSRAMIVLIIGCLGVVVLMKGLSADGNSPPSNLHNAPADNKQLNLAAKHHDLSSKNDFHGAQGGESNLRPRGAQPILHPPAPQEKTGPRPDDSEETGIHGAVPRRRVPDVASQDHVEKVRNLQQPQVKNGDILPRPPSPRDNFLSFNTNDNKSNKNSGVNAKILNKNINSDGASDARKFANLAQNMQMKHQQVAPIARDTN